MTLPPLSVEEIRRIALFADVPDDDLAWLSARAPARELAPGDALFASGDPADLMFLLVEGELLGRIGSTRGDAPTFDLRAPRVTGLLPFSRLTHYNGTVTATTFCRMGQLPRADFPALFQRLPQLEARFVGQLADRVRDAARLEDQQSRLMELGKISAGLAHELGNPAAALGRASAALDTELQRLTAACTLLAGRPEGAKRLAEVEQATPPGTAPTDPMLRSDAEERLALGLERLGIGRAWELAPELVEAGLPERALLETLAALPADAREPVLAWTASRLATKRLLAQVQEAVGRITGIVGAVKTYAHLDRAATSADIDIRQGLRSTLMLLGHELRGKRIRVVEALADDLPCIPGYAGELNQIWTNLIANAIDALPDSGTLTLRAHATDELVIVEVEDDGPGIPPELLDRIWEPFFTTKAAGHGTGLGLDVVKVMVERRHAGRVTVESEPGRTVFQVRLRRKAGVIA